MIACKPKWSGSVSEHHFSVSPRQISEESRREAEVQTEGRKEVVCPFSRGHSVCPAPFFLFSQSLLPPALPPSQFLLFNCVPYPITLFKCYLFALTFSCPCSSSTFSLPICRTGFPTIVLPQKFAFLFHFNFHLTFLLFRPLLSQSTKSNVVCSCLLSSPVLYLASISPSSSPSSYHCCRALLAHTNFRLITAITSINERGLSS